MYIPHLVFLLFLMTSGVRLCHCCSAATSFAKDARCLNVHPGSVGHSVHVFATVWAYSANAIVPETFHPTSKSQTFVVEASPPHDAILSVLSFRGSKRYAIRLLRRVASWARSMSTVVGGDQPSDLLLIRQTAIADQPSRSVQAENTVSDTCFTSIFTIMVRQW